MFSMLEATELGSTFLLVQSENWPYEMDMEGWSQHSSLQHPKVILIFYTMRHVRKLKRFLKGLLTRHS